MSMPLSSRFSKWRALAAACLLTGVGSVAHAGFYTNNEAGMDAIFSQSIFGANTIDIRFNSVLTVHNTSLMIIDGNGDAELSALDAINGNSKTVGMFFVDSITYCGGPTSSTVGCAFLNDNVIALNSSFTAGAYGAKLASHELGHALGLAHLADANNLMNGTINASTNALLNSDQVNLIGLSNLVQTDALTGKRFITIQPYEVLADLVANTVPEPGTLLLAGLALGAVAASRRGQRPSTQARPA